MIIFTENFLVNYYQKNIMTKFIKSIFVFVLLSFVLSGCSDIFDTHPYDVKATGKTYINVKNIDHIEKECFNKDTLKIAFISDTHLWLRETDDMVNNINNRNDIDFIVHLGDLSDTGTLKEFNWTRDILEKLIRPYVAMIGNHDFLGTGDEIYKIFWGEFDFSFIAGRIKFVCLNTNAIEYDYLAAVPNFDFMEVQRSSDSVLFDRTIICMHARPYSEQFNNNAAKAFEYYVRSFPNLMFCVNGHNHALQADDLYRDGVMYYGVDCAENRNYMIFTITPKDYQYEVVRF